MFADFTSDLSIYQNIYFSRFYFKHQDRLPQSQESKKSFSLLNSRKKEEKVNWPHHWKDNGQICQFLSPDKNTWTRPRPSTISFQVELKMCIYYELYCCTSYGNWNLYQHVVPFRTTHICIRAKQNISESLMKVQFLVILRRKFSN